MLQIDNLTKIYKPKKGVPVVALDHISLTLPDRGMVFLLGKSGSGKSTLLNLLGGLDSYDGGEILIKGNSSKGFRQQHFDSYRNTYVGFIFQEYNILEEFTVGANIALAIELQGIKATDQQINAILKEVDLDGYGGRRPNELSGGQKQRVAIARALVKQPRIIMADEPTGALDSNTGRQIFDTLKKLSAERLVIVVSHDREFAEQYADRIIELADGRVISDLTYEATETVGAEEPLTYAGDTVHITAGYRLTEEDRQAINAYIAALQTGAKLQINGHSTGKRAVATDNAAIRTDHTGFQLIKSRLPMRSAFKIGASSLKHKRFRLVVTILLSCIAFGLFGLADTFGSYNHIQACTDSLIDSNVGYASVRKAVLDEEYDYYRTGYHITDADITEITRQTGVQMKGIYEPMEQNLSFYELLDTEKYEESEERGLYLTHFNGFSEITAAELPDYGYDLIAGSLPDGSRDEVAITAYAADTFITFGLANPDTGRVDTIGSYRDLIGRKLVLADDIWTITGVVDTHFDLNRYEILRTQPENESTAQQLVRFALEQELYYAQQYSLHPTLLTGSGRVQAMTKDAYTVRKLNYSYLYFEDTNGNFAIDPYYIGTIADAKGATIHWLDGVSRTTLGEKELVISLDTMDSFGDGMLDIHTEKEDGMSVSGESIDPETVKQMLNTWQQENGPFAEFSDRCYDEEGNRTTIDGYTIVGYIDPNTVPTLRRAVLTHESLRDALTEHDEGPYSLAVGVMPTNETDIRQLVTFCYQEEAVRFQLQNAVTYELDTIHEVLVVLADVFLYIGLGFALFAALMLTNFISTSISYKKQEIGILRAIGSRSNDVFRIFFSESFLIAMINFVLSGAGVCIATGIINHILRNQLNILITVLHFGIRQILLLLVVSLLVAAVASFFPVYRIAAKRPIDAIRNR